MLEAGKRNMRFCSTAKNQRSPRGHCIFNIKLAKVCESETTASTLSLCDLACCTRLQNMCTCKFILLHSKESEVCERCAKVCESETTASTLSLCDLACCTRLQNMCTCKFILKKLREIEVDSTQEACQILEAGKRNMRFCSTAKNQRCARGVPKCARVKRRLVRYRCVTWPAVPDYRTCALVSLFKKNCGRSK